MVTQRNKPAITVIEDRASFQTQCVVCDNPSAYLQSMMQIVPRPDDLQILAIAKLGRAIGLVRAHLAPLHVRNSWYSREARDIFIAAAENPDAPILMLDAWIATLLIERRETGRIEPTKLCKAPVELNGFDITAIARGAFDVAMLAEKAKHPRRRSGRAPGVVKLYDHPRRQPGRPRKHFLRDGECACGDLWPCPGLSARDYRAARVALGDVLQAERHLGHQNGNVFSSGPQNHQLTACLDAPTDIEAQRTTPAWALGLAALAVRDPARDRAQPTDEPSAGPTPPSKIGG